jgi:hypothetical protein
VAYVRNFSWVLSFATFRDDICPFVKVCLHDIKMHMLLPMLFRIVYDLLLILEKERKRKVDGRRSVPLQVIRTITSTSTVDKDRIGTSLTKGK